MMYGDDTLAGLASLSVVEPGVTEPTTDCLQNDRLWEEKTKRVDGYECHTEQWTGQSPEAQEDLVDVICKPLHFKLQYVSTTNQINHSLVRRY
jgi:hypothetical protein